MAFVLLGALVQDPKLVEAFLEAREHTGLNYSAARDRVTAFGEAAIEYLDQKREDRSWEARRIAEAMILRIRDGRRAGAFDAEFDDLAHPDRVDETRAERPHFEQADAPLLIEQWLKGGGRPVPSKKLGGRQPMQERLVAFEELASMADLALVEPLLPALEGDRAEEVARLIVACGDPAVPKLREMAADKRVGIRCIAIEGLGARPWEEVRDLFRKALGDPEAWVRSTVAAQLARSGAVEARALVESLLTDDKDVYVRVAAADALRTMGPGESADALLEALTDKTFTVSTASARALSDTGLEKIRLPMRRQLQDYTQEQAAGLRRWCIRGLGSVGWDGDAPLVAEFAGDASEAVRAEVAVALMKMDPGGRRALVIEMLDRDPSARVRRACIEGLGLGRTPEGDAEVRPALEAALKDEDPAVREAAAALIKEMEP